MAELNSILFGVMVLMVLIWIWVMIPIQMAKKRKREPGIWLIVSILGTPLIAILALLALGDAE